MECYGGCRVLSCIHCNLVWMCNNASKDSFRTFVASFYVRTSCPVAYISCTILANFNQRNVCTCKSDYPLDVPMASTFMCYSVPCCTTQSLKYSHHCSCLAVVLLSVVLHCACSRNSAAGICRLCVATTRWTNIHLKSASCPGR